MYIMRILNDQKHADDKEYCTICISKRVRRLLNQYKAYVGAKDTNDAVLKLVLLWEDYMHD
jgi:hypothetical protein